jgi:RNA polymerase sigma factor (sigma-70 family)
MTDYNKLYIELSKDDFIALTLPLVTVVSKKFYNLLDRFKIDYDDLFQIGTIGLLKAYNGFKPDKAKWSTYACKCIYTEYLTFIRSEKSKIITICENEMIGLDGEDFIFEKATYDDYSLIEGIDIKEIKGIMKSLNDREKFVINCMMKGLTQDKIALKINKAQGQVSRILRKIREKVKKDKGEKQ